MHTLFCECYQSEIMLVSISNDYRRREKLVKHVSHGLESNKLLENIFTFRKNFDIIYIKLIKVITIMIKIYIKFII